MHSILYAERLKANCYKRIFSTDSSSPLLPSPHPPPSPLSSLHKGFHMLFYVIIGCCYTTQWWKLLFVAGDTHRSYVFMMCVPQMINSHQPQHYFRLPFIVPYAYEAFPLNKIQHIPQTSTRNLDGYRRSEECCSETILLLRRIFI